MVTSGRNQSISSWVTYEILSGNHSKFGNPDLSQEKFFIFEWMPLLRTSLNFGTLICVTKRPPLFISELSPGPFVSMNYSTRIQAGQKYNTSFEKQRSFIFALVRFSSLTFQASKTTELSNLNVEFMVGKEMKYNVQSWNQFLISLRKLINFCILLLSDGLLWK